LIIDIYCIDKQKKLGIRKMVGNRTDFVAATDAPVRPLRADFLEAI
jgi:hypothetical protein